MCRPMVASRLLLTCPFQLTDDVYLEPCISKKFWDLICTQCWRELFQLAMSAVGYRESMAACCSCVVGAGMCCPSKPSGTQAPVSPSAIGCWEFSMESFSRNGPQPKRPASPRAVHSCCCRWQKGQLPLTQGRISEGSPPTPEFPSRSVDALVVTALQPNSSPDPILLLLLLSRYLPWGQAQ